MFGSDWPLAELAGGYQRWKNAYEELSAALSPAEQAALDGRNARRVYGIG
jgi:L-fuconolactonase